MSTLFTCTYYNLTPKGWREVKTAVISVRETRLGTICIYTYFNELCRTKLTCFHWRTTGSQGSTVFEYTELMALVSLDGST